MAPPKLWLLKQEFLAALSANPGSVGKGTREFAGVGWLLLPTICCSTMARLRLGGELAGVLTTVEAAGEETKELYAESNWLAPCSMELSQLRFIKLGKCASCISMAGEHCQFAPLTLTKNFTFSIGDGLHKPELKQLYI